MTGAGSPSPVVGVDATPEEVAVARALFDLDDCGVWLTDPGPHSGDCTKECHTCRRCLQDEYLAKARAIIAAHESALLDRLPPDLARLREPFDRCKLWPEHGWPEGIKNEAFMAMLEIRNALPDLLDRVAALTRERDEARQDAELSGEAIMLAREAFKERLGIGAARIGTDKGTGDPPGIISPFFDDLCHAVVNRCLAEKSRAESAERSVAELTGALTPIGPIWEKKSARYVRLNSNWHNDMPDEWPIDITLTMGQIRAMVAVLSPEGRDPTNE